MLNMQSLNFHSSVVLNSAIKNLIRSVTTTAEILNTVELDSLKSWKEIPGPSTLPLIGSMHHCVPGGIFYKYSGVSLSKKLYETYGPIVRVENLIGRDPVIYIYDPDSAAKILRNENMMPVRPGFDTLKYYRKVYKNDAHKTKLTGLLTDSGKEWKELRTAVNSMMLLPETVKLYTSDLEKIAIDMVDRIRNLRTKPDWIETKLGEEMNLWALESTGYISFGHRLGCLDNNVTDNNSPTKQLIDCICEEFSLFKQLDFSPTLWKYFPTKKYRRAMALLQKEEAITMHLINEAKKNFGKEKGEKSVLQKLIEINENYGHKMIIDMMFGGFESISNTIIAFLYLLAINPEKQVLLRKELQSGSEKKPYLKACLKESIRMMPISVGVRRMTTKEYNIQGYKIPPNMYVLLGHQLMSLLEENYPRPDEYIPERWLVKKDDPLHYANAHPFAHSPFGFGTRSCIARRISELMMELLALKMVENFQIEWTGHPAVMKETIINYFRGPYNFVFKDVPKT